MPEWLHYTGLAVSVLIFTWFLSQVASSVKENGKAIGRVFDKVEELESDVFAHAKDCDTDRAVTHEKVTHLETRVGSLETRS